MEDPCECNIQFPGYKKPLAWLVSWLAEYCSLNIVRVNKSTRLSWAGHVARMEKSMGALNFLTVQHGCETRSLTLKEE